MANDLEARSTIEAALPRLHEPSPYTSYAGHGNRDGGFDGPRFTQFIRENYRLFLFVVIVTLILAAGATLLMTKKYSTNATVMLDQRHQQVVQGLSDVVSDLPGQDSSIVDTEVQLLSSAGMAYQVGRATGMIPDVDLTKISSDQRDEISETVRDIMKHRSIERVGLTYVIEIYYTSPDPVQAQTVADAFAQTYIASQIDVRVQANERARAHLSGEITKLQAQVKVADAAVAQYKAANNLSDTMMAGTLTDQEITSYNQALAGARAQEAEDSQRLASARGQLTHGSDALGDTSAPGLLALRQQESQLSAKVADLSSRYGPNHPELLTAQEQLKDVERLIGDQSKRTIASLQSQAQASAGRSTAIANKLAQTESDLQRGGEASVKLHDLQANLDAPKKLLEAYQARLAEISTQSGSEQADSRIISDAPYPLIPTSPKWIVNMILGLGAGLIFGTFAVLARQVFAVGMRSPEDVETSLGVDFFATLPRLRAHDDVAIINKVVDEPHSPFAEAVRSLAATIVVGQSAKSRIIAITSAFASESKTTTTIALGRVVAMRSRRVLMIDCDLQRPSFENRFGIGKGFGLVEILDGKISIEDAISKDVLTHAHFLPLGQALEPGRTIDEQKLANLLESLRANYDAILIDLPPVLQVAETRVIAALADKTIVLARWRHTSRQAIEMTLSTLHRSRAAVAGIALTQVPASSEMLVGTYGSSSRLLPSVT